MMQSRLWAVILAASGAACGPSLPAVPETYLVAEGPLAESELAPDQIVHLSILDLSVAEDHALAASPLAEVLVVEREQLLGCWGSSAGQVTLSLELDSKGGVVGGSTDPGGGQEGIAAVADCVLSLALAWRFPASESGGTRLLVAPLRVTNSSDEKE